MGKIIKVILMNTNFSIYLFDEEISFIEGLQKLIDKMFPLANTYKAYEGVDAWKLIEKEKGPALIICQYDIPGINGLQILKKLRAESNIKEAFFILVFSKQDKELILKCVQAGVDDYMLKPVAIDQLILKIKTASKFVSYQAEVVNKTIEYNKIKDILEKGKIANRNMLIKLQEYRFLDQKKEMLNIVMASEYIAKRLFDSADEIANVRLAAELCYLGKIFLNDKYLNQPVLINGLSPNNQLAEVPKFINSILTGLDGFDEVRKILYHTYENFDGSGIPEKLQSWKIPLGARILRVAIDFEYFLVKNSRREDKAIEALEHEMNRLYDFRVVAFHDQFLASLNFSYRSGLRYLEMPVNIQDLKPGMIISRNIMVSSGLKLIGSQTILDEEKIDRISSISSSDSIIGELFVRK